MYTWLFWLTLVMAVLEWTAVAKGWKRVRWLTKPGTMVLLIAWFTQVGGWQGPKLWFGLGLVFSLLGDIFLMLPKRFFLAGMGAFFTAHVFTVVGFNQHPLALTWQVMVPMLAVAGAFSALNGRIRSGLRTKGENKLIIPVMAYATILSVMWLAALSTLYRPDWLRPAAILASIGGGLFFFSDSVLVYNRFVRLIVYGDIAVMVSYHLAQISIAMAVVIQYL